MAKSWLEIDCPDCEAPNWIDQGFADDNHGVDIDCFKCHNCKRSYDVSPEMDEITDHTDHIEEGEAHPNYVRYLDLRDRKGKRYYEGARVKVWMTSYDHHNNPVNFEDVGTIEFVGSSFVIRNDDGLMMAVDLRPNSCEIVD